MPPRQAKAAVKATRPRVYARVKPNVGEDAGAAELFTITDTTLEYLKEEGAEATKFGFDKVFGMGSTQDEIFEDVGETSLRALRQGFNSTVMAYGQTGAGKSFSMEGGAADKGLVPRIFQRSFELFGGDADIKSFEISLQFLELYNEQLQDLLNERKPVDVTADPAGGYVCKNATKTVITSAQHAEQVYAAGCAARATNTNQARSHGLVLLNVSWVEAKGKRAAGLSLVDLAGSEGLKKGRGAVKEGLKVNLSLTKLALVVKCLAEGTKNIPFRESKLTMILQKGLGGSNMLHVILALKNSKEQVEMGTASMRFGQACLSMTVRPDQGAVEKEQADMKSVVKEQMQEINALEAEMQDLKKQLEVRNSVLGGEVPDFMVAQHIGQNKEALQDDLREATEQIEELRKAIEEKKADIGKMQNSGAPVLDEAQFAGMEGTQKAEAMEKASRQAMVTRMKASAKMQNEKKALESELQQMLDVQRSMQEKLAKVEAETQTQEERIQREAEDRAKEMLAVKEEEAAQMTAMLKAREEASEQAGREQAERERHLQEQLKQREEMLAAEEQQRKALMASSAEDSSKMQEEMAKLAAEREKFERDIEATKADQERLKAAEAEAVKAKQLHATQEAELQAMRDEIASMAKGNAPKASMAGMGSSGFKAVPDMIAATAKKMARKAKGGRTDPVALQRVISTLPVLSACNDLRALTEIEATNRTLFQTLGGLYKMIDYLSPNGPNAPYATHIARTLPAIMDREGRDLFNQYATGTDSHGEVRLKYFSALLVSKDPDDKEHACLAIASVAQDSQANRVDLFKHGISVQVLEVLLETCRQQMPRQRLQRVVVMALSELAQDYDDFKNAIREAGGVQQLLQLLTPSHDPFVIKETLALIGRITQGNTGIQAELQSLGAIQVYSQLLFAQMHDTAITELAALALVNLVSEVPKCMADVEQHARFSAIRFELLASMARALSSSMLRKKQKIMTMPGSAEFGFWGACAVGNWGEATAGGDRTHTSFVDNPQFVLRAPAGTNLCIVLHDCEEDTRQKEKIKTRPLFLRLCVTAATPEALESRLKVLDINSSGARPAAMDADSVVQLEPGVNGFLDVAKTREVTMRCHVKNANAEQAWVIVPHVGCSHQHSKFILSVFADREVSLDGELQPWTKRVITSSWSSLACAPNSIVDANWRNCPQFQLINMGEKATPVRALLSYGERDEMLNKRHLQTFDQQMSSAEERPMLSMYVMKANVPDKRFIATLSPQVDNYVCHSLVTNSWCVQSKWDLEPGNVYAVLAVMAEGTTHEVPLRLTLFTQPDLDTGTVVEQPLTPDSEWHLTALQGFTSGDGSNTLSVVCEAPEGQQVQATLVIETEEAAAFCSISTSVNDQPYKQTPTYAQKQAVLSMPLVGGSTYAMTTRCITQRQEPIKNGPMRLLLYSTAPLKVEPTAGQQLSISIEAGEKMVSDTTSAGLTYGEEVVPEDTKKPAPVEDSEEQSYDPAVVQAVMHELEEQRNNLFAFTKAEGKEGPPAILEDLRKGNEDLKSKVESLRAEAANAKAMSERQGASGQEKEAAAGALRQNAELKKLLDEANQQIAELQAGGGGGGGGGGGDSDARVAQLQQQLRVAQQQAAAGGGGGGGGADAGEMAKAEAMIASLQKDLASKTEESRKQQAQLAEAPKSGACLVM